MTSVNQIQNLCHQKFMLDMKKSLYKKCLVNFFDSEYSTEIFIKAFHTLQTAFNSASCRSYQEKEKMEVLR